MFFRINYSKILILGSGPSGFTNSLYLIKSNLNPILITGKILGGQLIKTNYIDNWPGIYYIEGYDLIKKFLNQLEKIKIEIIYEEIFILNLLINPFFLLSFNKFFLCNFIIICTGSLQKYLNIKNEFKFLNKNISFCCICDGNFYKNKLIAIIGGGNVSIESSLYLINISKKLLIIHRNKFFNSDFFLLKNFFNIKKKYIIKLNTFLFEIIFDDFLIKYIKLKNKFFNIYNIFYLDGLFLFIGNKPNNFIFKGQIKLIKNYIYIKKQINYEFSKTNVFSIFSSGDVVNKFYKQIIISSGFGCISSIDCIYLHNKIFY